MRRFLLICWVLVALLSAFLPATLTSAGPRKIIDRDGDFLEDRYEWRRFRTSKFKRDSNRNGVKDGDEDYDGDGILNKDEYERDDLDRDKDGLADENERQWGCDPRNPDTDNDGILDGNDNDGSLPNFEDRDDRSWEGPRFEDRDDNATPRPTRKPTRTKTPVVTATPTRGRTPTVAPTSTRRPTPTRTPTISPENCFDSSGNVQGCFGIPSEFVGNRFRGATIWAGTCTTCHVSEKRYAQYTTVTAALVTIPEMRDSLHLLEPEVADVVAYLNRP